MFAKHALTLLTASTLAAPIVLAGHHEGIQPPAETGQVVVTYRGNCPSEAVDSTLKKM